MYMFVGAGRRGGSSLRLFSWRVLRFDCRVCDIEPKWPLHFDTQRDGLLHLRSSVGRRRCVECWCWVVMLIGTSPCAVICVPPPLPLHGVRLLAIWHVLVCFFSMFAVLTAHSLPCEFVLKSAFSHPSPFVVHSTFSYLVSRRPLLLKIPLQWVPSTRTPCDSHN